MDTFVSVVAFLPSVAFTVLLYGIGPAALVHFRKRPLAKWKLRLFSVFYSLLIWLSVNAVNVILYSGEFGSGGAMFLWGCVFYHWASGKLCSSAPVGRNAEKEAAKQPPETWYTCPDCGCLVRTGEACDCKKNPNASELNEIVLTYIQPGARLDSSASLPLARKRRFKPLALVLSLLLIASLVVNLLQFKQRNELVESTVELQASLERERELSASLKASLEHEQELTSSLKEVRSRLLGEIRKAEKSQDNQDSQSVATPGKRGRLVKIK